MSLSSLANKTCVITGATGGIGFAIAQRFAREGAHVVLVGRAASADKLRELRRYLQQQQQQQQQGWPQGRPQVREPSRHEYVETDILHPEGWTQIVEQCQTIDVLVNCAGTSQESLLMRTPSSRIDEILSVNLRAAILGCQAVGKQMIKAKTKGCIINVSSLLATKGRTGTSVYSASKAGLLGLTTSLAVEYGAFGIRVNAIVPGYIATRMTEGLDTQQSIKTIPLKRFGTDTEIADAAAFLAKNDYANNCILNLDGGLSAI